MFLSYSFVQLFAAITIYINMIVLVNLLADTAAGGGGGGGGGGGVGGLAIDNISGERGILSMGWLSITTM